MAAIDIDFDNKTTIIVFVVIALILLATIITIVKCILCPICSPLKCFYKCIKKTCKCVKCKKSNNNGYYDDEESLIESSK